MSWLVSSPCAPLADHGISFYESFGDLALTTYLHVVGLRDLGPTMAPMNAYLTLCGVETLPLRMERHVRNATAVAEFLSTHPAVAWVSHASQPTSPYHGRVPKYCPAGPGSVFTIGAKHWPHSFFLCIPVSFHFPLSPPSLRFSLSFPTSSKVFCNLKWLVAYRFNRTAWRVRGWDESRRER